MGSVHRRASVISLPGSINTKRYADICENFFQFGIKSEMIREGKKEMDKIYEPQNTVTSQVDEAQEDYQQSYHREQKEKKNEKKMKKKVRKKVKKKEKENQVGLALLNTFSCSALTACDNNMICRAKAVSIAEPISFAAPSTSATNTAFTI